MTCFEACIEYFLKGSGHPQWFPRPVPSQTAVCLPSPFQRESSPMLGMRRQAEKRGSLQRETAFHRDTTLAPGRRPTAGSRLLAAPPKSSSYPRLSPTAPPARRSAPPDAIATARRSSAALKRRASQLSARRPARRRWAGVPGVSESRAELSARRPVRQHGATESGVGDGDSDGWRERGEREEGDRR